MRQEVRDKIRGKIKELGYSNNASFAEAIEMHPKTFDRKLNGHHDFFFDEIEKMVDVFGIRNDSTEIRRIFF